MSIPEVVKDWNVWMYKLLFNNLCVKKHITLYYYNEFERVHNNEFHGDIYEAILRKFQKKVFLKTMPWSTLEDFLNRVKNIQSGISYELIKLCKDCLQHNETDRPSIQEIVNCLDKIDSKIKQNEFISSAKRIKLENSKFCNDIENIEYEPMFTPFIPIITRAICYENGCGIEINKKESLKWYLISAENGKTESQRRLGDYYNDGTGTLINIIKSIYWFQKAREGKDTYSSRILDEFIDSFDRIGPIS
ncbi:7260_t:CDS:2 [Diversispora eburnea]|uniref:7260_t:CDS:1 n=1 Tax=Diversispora eburnea TaxID=1213867 RepID=A0A9N8V0C4_9GLOM|nr:7260_t:CDS:2 [Diversispora eburnea]